jgi:fluoride exporter
VPATHLGSPSRTKHALPVQITTGEEGECRANHAISRIDCQIPVICATTSKWRAGMAAIGFGCAETRISFFKPSHEVHTASSPLVGCDASARAERGRRSGLVSSGDSILVAGGAVTEMGPVLAVSLGGILGANARYFVALYIAERFGAAFPYGTLLINVSGSLVIGFFLTLVTERVSIDPLWRLFFATGFLGAYTTFSTYTYEAAHLLRAGEYGPALVYLLGSVVLGMIGVLAGILVAERI